MIERPDLHALREDRAVFEPSTLKQDLRGRFHTRGSGSPSGVTYPAVTDGGHIRKLEEVEADMIRLALHRYRGQMSEVARKLGIGRSTLYRKMRDLGLEEANM